jgi:hypothetical protein
VGRVHGADLGLVHYEDVGEVLEGGAEGLVVGRRARASRSAR